MGYFNSRLLQVAYLPQQVYLRNSWFELNLSRSLGLSAQYMCGGFCGDEGSRHRISLVLGFLSFYLKLPIRRKTSTYGTVEKYGFAVHSNALWLHFGKKLKCLDFPWALEHYRTSLYLKDYDWIHEYKHNREDLLLWDTEKWSPLAYTETHPYTYVLESGKEQHAMVTCRLEEREWRRKWLPFTSKFAVVRRSVDITSDIELGERAGSWKGGVTGFSQDIDSKKPIKSNTIADALKESQTTRKFR